MKRILLLEDNALIAKGLRFTLEGGQTLLLRPSGTEPKLKCYLMVTAGDRNAALELEERLRRDVEARIRRTGADIK